MDPIPEGAACDTPECESPPVGWSTNRVPIVLLDEDGNVIHQYHIGEADVVFCTEHLKEEP